MGQYPDREAMVTDACVPLSGLPILISEARRMLDESGIPSPIIAHAGAQKTSIYNLIISLPRFKIGDGNIHVVLMVRTNDAAELAVAKDLASKMVIFFKNEH